MDTCTSPWFSYDVKMEILIKTLNKKTKTTMNQLSYKKHYESTVVIKAGFFWHIYTIFAHRRTDSLTQKNKNNQIRQTLQ